MLYDILICMYLFPERLNDQVMSFYQQVKEKFILTNAWEDWASYRSHLTDIILENNPKSLMLIGAGRCNDVDLLRISLGCDSVVCIDTDSDAVCAAISKLPDKLQENVSFKEVSLTGIDESDLEHFCNEIIGIIRLEGRNLTDDRLRKHLFSGIESLKDKMFGSEEKLSEKLQDKSVDTVVCCGVHSQLFSTLSFFIRSLISSLGEILQNPEGLENEIYEMIRKMNRDIIPIINRSIYRTARETIIIGNEFSPDNPVEGASQCISQVRSNLNPIEIHLKWEFNRAEGIIYDMLIQICNVRSR